MSMADRIRQARKAKGYSQSRLASILDVSQGTIGNYESGISTPKEPILFNLMSALDVDANYLFQDEMQEASAKLAPDAREWSRPLDTAYAAAPDPTQRNVCKLLDIPHVIPDVSPSDDEEEEKDEADIFDNSSAAGSGNYIHSDSYETLRFPAGTVPLDADCGVRISGHSMEPDIKDGDIVWVHETCEILNHQVGIFIINEDNAVCKRAKLDESGHLIRLMSDNPAVPDIEIEDLEDVRVFGRVLGAYTPK